MKKVLIFGAEGMLGSALVDRFSKDHLVEGLDYHDVDITDFKAVEKKIKEDKPDLIINAAAYNNVDEAEKDALKFELAKKINGTAVGNMGKVSRELDIPIVHFSSEYVFDGEKKSGYAEDAEVSPLNRYGESKALGEKVLKDNTDKYYLIRLSRMFGPAGKNESTKKSFVDTMIESFQEGKTEFKVVDEELSCPTYSIDLANLVYDLTNKVLPFGIYHGANSGACTWFQLAKKTFELRGLSPRLMPVKGGEFPRPAKRPNLGELINTKLQKQRSWEDALKEYLA